METHPPFLLEKKMKSIPSRDTKKIFKANALQPITGGVSATGFDTTVRNIGSGQVILLGYLLHNNDNAARWLQIFFRPASEVILGTTAPDMTVLVGASASLLGSLTDDENNIRQGTGLSVACTTTEIGTTGPTAAMTGSIFYWS